jgi:hypothetical protein
MIRLNEEIGQFLLSWYGNGYALGFAGDEDFIERCFNWTHNTGVISLNQRLEWFYGKGGRFAYVCPQTTEDILIGLTAQFRVEIIQDKEVPLLKDEWDDENECPILEYDEKAINRLAHERAKAFFEDRIVLENFMCRQPVFLAPIYEMGVAGRADVAAEA